MFRPSCIGAIVLCFFFINLSWAMQEQPHEGEEAYNYLLTQLTVPKETVAIEIDRVKKTNFYEVAKNQLVLWQNFVEMRKKKAPTTLWGIELGTQYGAVLGGLFGSSCSLILGVAVEGAHLAYFGTSSHVSLISATWLGGTSVGYILGYLGQKKAEEKRRAKNQILIMQEELRMNIPNFDSLSAKDQFALLAIYSGLIKHR